MEGSVDLRLPCNQGLAGLGKFLRVCLILHLFPLFRRQFFLSPYQKGCMDKKESLKKYYENVEKELSTDPDSKYDSDDGSCAKQMQTVSLLKV